MTSVEASSPASKGKVLEPSSISVGLQGGHGKVRSGP